MSCDINDGWQAKCGCSSEGLCARHEAGAAEDDRIGKCAHCGVTHPEWDLRPHEVLACALVCEECERELDDELTAEQHEDDQCACLGHRCHCAPCSCDACARHRERSRRAAVARLAPADCADEDIRF